MFLKILENVNLAQYTSWLIGGTADHFCQPTNLEELIQAVRAAHEKNWAITILSGGSNVLVSDAGVRGLTMLLNKFSMISHEIKDDRIIVQCLSGTAKSELLKLFLKNQLPPALFLAGLPGDVGGGVAMNAGVAEAFEPREFMDMVDWIEVLDEKCKIKRFQKTELKISYRHCDGWQPGIITTVQISWPLVVDPQVLTKVREANKIRLSKQPLDKPSCGSVFRNPEGHKAAQLIDQAGLKGFTIGEAQVSLKHANFIVNLGQATAQDTLAVIEHVQKTVKQVHGVQLTTEVVRLGEWSKV
ncbi:MAG: UDP-N-acetylmuramate dehydrogenase [Bdellovibrio sp.]|nr:UDP-N-acetylmuramate dehydrogenase [Bdellovibrio sp.]